MKLFFVLLWFSFVFGFVRAADIAVVAPPEAYGTSLSKHLCRWLKAENVNCELVPVANVKQGTQGKKLVYWVMPTGSPNELAAMKSLAARHAKSVVFFSHSPAIAALMGVRLGEYKRPVAGTYARIQLAAAARITGAPNEISQSSANIFTATPIAGKSRVVGFWCDRAGRNTGDAAVLASSAGWWITHVFLADGDEGAKACFLAALAGISVPNSWSAAMHQAREEARHRSNLAYARAQQTRASEIRAVWDHSGQGLYPGDWARTISLLRANHITDLYVNVGGAGFAHFASSVLPRSSVFDTQGDQLTACLAAAKGSGVRVHAWILCFTATRGTPSRLANFAERGWRLKNAKGLLTEYLDPGNTAVRQYVISALKDIATRYPVAGIHLDFVRYYEGAARTASTRAFFDGRTRNVTSFVLAASRVIRQARKGCIVSAAVLGKYPSCVDAVGQDWVNWIDTGLVDFVTPMNYTENMARYNSLVGQQGSVSSRAQRTISGIGVTANESRLGVREVIDQIVAARRAGLAGVAFFDLDHTLVYRILPYLMQGVFR